jgi:uncharacterized protein YcnI
VLNSVARRGAVVLAAGAATVLALAGPALAHVEIEAAPARALATNVTLTLHGEAESSTAGVTGVRIQVPSGLLPADFRVTAAPPGWKAGTSGQVLTVRGAALPVGRSLDLTMRLRQLPAGGQLVLKTVQTYSDGSEDAWVELPSASVPEPDQPAPVVELAAAAAGATPLPRATTPAPAPTTTVPPVPEPTPSEPAAASEPPAAADDPAAGADDPAAGAGNAGWLFGGVGIGVLLLGGFVFALRRRADAENAAKK